jgi:hypothetical protein
MDEAHSDRSGVPLLLRLEIGIEDRGRARKRPVGYLKQNHSTMSSCTKAQRRPNSSTSPI